MKKCEPYGNLLKKTYGIVLNKEDSNIIYMSNILKIKYSHIFAESKFHYAIEIMFVGLYLS